MHRSYPHALHGIFGNAPCRGPGRGVNALAHNTGYVLAHQWVLYAVLAGRCSIRLGIFQAAVCKPDSQ